MTHEPRRILLIVPGGIAAYKVPNVIRLLQQHDVSVSCVLTRSGAQFITPLTLAAISRNPVRSSVINPESPMDHINLPRNAHAILVAPATADILARMRIGRADDLACASLLAADVPVLVAPSMNPYMWQNPAVQDNVNTLKQRGVSFINPSHGDTACGEHGEGRMAEPEIIADAVLDALKRRGALAGKRALVSAGPTHEPIDPVRYIANRSSGRQGYALAHALAHAGADVSLVSGPCCLETPLNVRLTRVSTAQDMLDACINELPCDVAVLTAAVADWRPSSPSPNKTPKTSSPDALPLTPNPDILAALAVHPKRPQLLVGFAAETQNVINNAQDKLQRKQCDWIIANDVCENGVMGGDHNRVAVLRRNHPPFQIPRARKSVVAEHIVNLIADAL